MALGENATWVDVSEGWMQFGRSTKNKERHEYLKTVSTDLGKFDRFRIEARGNPNYVGCHKLKIIALDPDG